jgi:hypothetical protein
MLKNGNILRNKVITWGDVMIKIIKYGKKMRQICPQCECEFEFEREDIIWGNQREPDNYVKCPCCGRYIEISEVL